ncbi:PREDICTED: uncharacterized protein LOC106814710 [Priapulus caudatus]|uniref:Mannosyltransferase n=1 Tax=Priapulus caudatus TaxID=37621 RepID=A0ABM1EQS2_PRICU|nr:PREDICTED: uncharacterized protein LOC106814710 [Priapulus caudatus]
MMRHRPTSTRRRPGENGHGGGGHGARSHTLGRGGGWREDESGEDEEKEEECGFHPHTLWVLTALTLALRLNVVRQKQNWWILHPDEVFQSVEVAHTEAYGYGFRPYEYLDAPAVNGSAAERQRAALGMYSMRSFLHPHIYALLFTATRWLCFDANPFQVSKLFHTTVAASLPVAVHRFTKSALRSTDVATVAAAAVAFSPQLMVLGTHAFVNSLLSPVVFFLLAVLFEKLRATCDEYDFESCQELDSGQRQFVGHRVGDGSGRTADDGRIAAAAVDKNQNSTIKTHVGGARQGRLARHLAVFACGAALGVVCYVRLDVAALLAVSVALYWLPRLRTLLPCFATLAVGFAVGFLVGCGDDYVRYGVFGVSPRQWFAFNVREGHAARLFGWQGAGKYLEDVFLENAVVAAMFASPALTLLCRTQARRSHLLMWATALLLLALYSAQRHKEPRFVHNVIVLQTIAASAALVAVVRATLGRRRRSGALYALMAAFVVNGCCHLPDSRSPYNGKWSYASATTSQDVNECLFYVGQQPDVTGVVVDYTIHLTGGYTLLHRDVPLIARTHYEYREWSAAARVRTPSRGYLRDATVAVATIDDIADFVSVENAPLLLRRVASRPEYNYAVVRGDGSRLLPVGFARAHTARRYSVLRRQGGRAERALLHLAEGIPVGSNATVLEYEASWLMTFGHHRQAIVRLRHAIALGSTRRRPYQLLYTAYTGLGAASDARAAMRECAAAHGEQVCRTPQAKVVLHQEYNLDL